MKKRKDSTAGETARAILDFTSRSDVSDFISNAVMIAIDGAAIAHNQPQPYMTPEETTRTATPKVAAILTAAGELFDVQAALRAKGYYADTGEQHTKIPMQPIEDDDARCIADELTNIGISDRDRQNLIELICGIAAINNPVTRQEVTADAVRAIYLNLDGFEGETGAFVARIYAESQKGDSQ